MYFCKIIKNSLVTRVYHSRLAAAIADLIMNVKCQNAKCAFELRTIEVENYRHSRFLEQRYIFIYLHVHTCPAFTLSPRRSRPIQEWTRPIFPSLEVE